MPRVPFYCRLFLPAPHFSPVIDNGCGSGGRGYEGSRGGVSIFKQFGDKRRIFLPVFVACAGLQLNIDICKFHVLTFFMSILSKAAYYYDKLSIPISPTLTPTVRYLAYKNLQLDKSS